MSADPISSVVLGWAATAAACILVAGGAYHLTNLLRVRVRIARRIHVATDGLSGLRIERRMADSATELKSTIGNTVASLGRLMPLGDDDREKIALSLNRAGYLSANALAIMLGIKFAGLAIGLLAGLGHIDQHIPGNARPSCRFGRRRARRCVTERSSRIRAWPTRGAPVAANQCRSRRGFRPSGRMSGIRAHIRPRAQAHG